MDLRPTFQSKYPTGYKGGQCGMFAHKLVEFPAVGDPLAAKKKTVERYGILKPKSFLPGDVVVTTDDPTYGHVFVVNAVVGNNLRASESNWKRDLRVTHDRLTPKTSSRIIGVLRGQIKFPINKPYMNPNVEIINNKGKVGVVVYAEDIPQLVALSKAFGKPVEIDATNGVTNADIVIPVK